jgi:hypothetical protein
MDKTLMFPSHIVSQRQANPSHISWLEKYKTLFPSRGFLATVRFPNVGESRAIVFQAMFLPRGWQIFVRNVCLLLENIAKGLFACSFKAITFFQCYGAKTKAIAREINLSPSIISAI